MVITDMSSVHQNSIASANGHPKSSLESSSKMVDIHLQADSSYPHLIDCLKKGGIPSLSGLSERDYPSLAELSRLHLLPLLNSAKRIPLPAELVEQFGHMQSNCQMGLFPEIGRAWLTIDSDIFMWSFEDGSDLAYFDGLNETILSVGLVKPKKGIFQNYIHYLLCITTPIEIVLLGVSFSRPHDTSSPFEEMYLLPEPLFSFPSDNTYMVSVHGTSDGRIFLGGRDGAIYEFAYQAEDGWFSRKCRKINHSSGPLSFLVPSFLNFAFSEDDAVVQIVVDDSRHILYARSEKGAIQVFDLGSDGKQMSKVTLVSQAAIVQNAMSIARNIDQSNFYPIVHISIVELSESTCVHLVAVTQSGVRMYFSTNTELKETRPYTLTLLHIRLPPGFSANSSPVRPSYVHIAHYRKGCLLLSSSQTDDQDLLWATSNDSFPSFGELIETYTTVPLDGRTWALCEIPPSFPNLACEDGTGSVHLIASDPPLVVTQHMELPRKFVFLSAQGSHIITKPRPVDLLRKLLMDSSGPDSEAVKAFFYLHKEVQACAMCLILACSQSLQDKQIAEWATRAFFLYGGEPRVNVIPSADITSGVESTFTSSPGLNTSSVWVSTPVPAEQQRPGGMMPFSFSNVYSPVKPVASSTQYPVQSSSLLSQQLTSPGTTGSSSEVVYSGKHDGLYLYFSRIMRPLWNTKLVSDIPVQFPETQTEFLVSSVLSEDLAVYIQQMAAFKDFMQNNSQFFGNVSASSSQNYSSRQFGSRMQFPSSGDVSSIQMQTQQKMPQSDAELQERISLINLQQLVNYTCEMLGLWKVLCDHQFHIVVSMIPEELRNQLKVLTFKDFIVNGKEISGALVNAVISLYLNDHASTDAISNRLREVCPSIYHEEDATISRAHEILLNAKNIVNQVEREKELKEALRLCKFISPHLNLGFICNLFQGVRFYHGIVDLCLCAAQRGDPQGLALHYYKNGEPKDDQQGFQAYVNRMKCYKAVIDTISHLMSLSTSHPQSPSVPKTPGPPPRRDPNLLSPEEAKNYSEQMFEMALKTDDELFHVALYDWLIDNNQTDTLLSIKSPFLENYLKRCTTLQLDNLPSLDLLWKYYEKNQNFSAASRILAKLADRQGSDITLAHRLEYLSRAIMCVKSSEIRVCAPGEGEFLHELEEKMEVARIQLKILETLQESRYPCGQDTIAKLNSNLLDVTQLYENFAETFDLPECKLAIVHCAGHYDPPSIEMWWQNTIDKELSATIGLAPETRVKMLRQKIISMSKTYMNSEKYFPLASIERYLELKTCVLNFDVTWVFNTFLSVGISVIDLLDIYHKLYRTKDSCWQIVKKPLHLLVVLSHLISRFVDMPTIVPLPERRAFTTQCLDYIAGYLVDLQAMSTTDPTVCTTMKDFKATQHKLERLQ